jgi:membrane fusion protein, multidrug efflux system
MAFRTDPGATLRCSRLSIWLRSSVALALLTAGHGVSAAVPVEAVMPEAGQAHTSVSFTGSFVAQRAAALSPRVSGLVAELEVDVGDRVTAGDVLVRLDGTLAQIEVERSAAALEEAVAALTEAQRLRDEGTDLGSRNALPATEVAARKAAVVVAEAGVSRANTDLAAARERLLRHRLVAPFDGVIASRATEAGEWVQTGDAVLELVGVDNLWLEVRAPQRYWPDVGPDTRVSVVADAFPQRSLEARVHARVPVSDPSARTFLVRLAVDGAEEITPGMSARASFSLGDGNEVLRVPRDAIVRYPDGTTTVWVVENRADAPQVREVAVDIGRFAGDQVEVVGGITATDPIVVRGNEGLSEGQPVRLTHSLPGVSGRPGAD